MQRWCVGDECWSHSFDESADQYVPKLLGHVVGLQCTGVLIATSGTGRAGWSVIGITYSERLFHSRAAALAAGVAVGGRPFRKRRVIVLYW